MNVVLLIIVVGFFLIFYYVCKNTQKEYEEFQKSASKKQHRKTNDVVYKEKGWVDDSGNIHVDVIEKNVRTGQEKVIRTRVKEKKNLTFKEQYQVLLQQPEWKQKRLEILNRDGHKCQWCGSTHNLQIHHKVYCKCPNGTRRKPWDYDNKVFMTLCDRCHKRYHEKYEVKTIYCKCNNR